MASLLDIREDITAYAAGFDAAALSGERALVALRTATAIKNVARTIEALCAGRVAETNQSARGGHRHAAEHVAKETGTTVGAARDALDTAKQLGAHPALDEAARRGELSPQLTDVIGHAAGADPDAVTTLLGKVRAGASLGEVREEAGRIKAAADPDPEARRRTIHAARFLRSWTDADGAGNLRMRENPEVIAQLMAAVDDVVEGLFHQARRAGRPEPREAYCADALVQLVTGAASATKPKAKVIFRVDLPAWLRGYPVSGEVMELMGYGPVAASAIDDAIAAGGFLAAVFTKGELLTGVAHLGRPPTARQQSALEWLYPSCAAVGCNAVARLERDHRIDWADSHITMLDWLDRLCSHHHGLKTRENWQLVGGRGKRNFVPPDDPRHPRHQHAPPQAAAR